MANSSNSSALHGGNLQLPESPLKFDIYRRIEFKRLITHDESADLLKLLQKKADKVSENRPDEVKKKLYENLRTFVKARPRVVANELLSKVEQLPEVEPSDFMDKLEKLAKEIVETKIDEARSAELVKLVIKIVKDKSAKPERPIKEMVKGKSAELRELVKQIDESKFAELEKKVREIGQAQSAALQVLEKQIDESKSAALEKSMEEVDQDKSDELETLVRKVSENPPVEFKKSIKEIRQAKSAELEEKVREIDEAKFAEHEKKAKEIDEAKLAELKKLVKEVIGGGSANHGTRNAQSKPAEKDDLVDLEKTLLEHEAALEKELLNEILSKMRTEPQEIGAVAIPKNPDIPAGFTYLGQFIAHDISYNQMCCGEERPFLRLQSIYGGGPVMMPYLYAHYPEHFENEGTASPNRTVEDDYNFFRDVKFRLEKRGKKYFDVPRFTDSLPCMADARNDQHFIISQLHCTFLRFHNAMAEYKRASGQQLDNKTLFDETRREMILTYQWIIVERYLKRLVYDGLIDKLMDSDEGDKEFKLYKVNSAPRLMPEFRQAAFRIGHSQILDVYLLNETGERRKIFSPDSLFPGNSSRRNDLRGFRQAGNLYIDWTVFFPIDDRVTPQPSASIDHLMAASLFELPFLQSGQRSLPKINLQRSEDLPSGKKIAEELFDSLDEVRKGREDLQVLTDKEVSETMGIERLTVDKLPLWLYILLEAEIKQGGKKLGLLGSHIVAEQIIWVLKRDDESYLSNTHYKKWSPIINFNEERVLEKFNQPSDPSKRKIELQDMLEFLDAAHKSIRDRRFDGQ